MEALGMIETKGLLGAIEVLDAMLKTANVSLVNKEKVGGGLTTILVRGDVSSVKTSVDAGKALAKQRNCLVSAHVIARCSTEVWDMILPQKKEPEVTKSIETQETEASTKQPELIEPEFEEENQEALTDFERNLIKKYETIEEMLEEFNYKKVVELREIVRKSNLREMENLEIKYANKEKLLLELQIIYKKSKNISED